QILALFVGEGLALGGLGAVLGIGFGLFLARTVLKLAGGRVAVLNMPVETDQLLIEPRDLIVSVMLGVVVAFIAAFFPARQAASTEPATVMRKSASNSSGIGISTLRTSLRVSGVTTAVAVAMAVYAHVQENYLMGYAV